MALWIKGTDGSSYWHIAAIVEAQVRQPFLPNDVNWWITASMSDGSGATLRGPFTTQALAQSALDTAIGNLGGAV